MQLKSNSNKSSPLQNQSHLHKGNEKNIGYNRYNNGINIPNVKDEICRSLSKRYYIIFDEKNIPQSKEELIERTKVFKKQKVLFVTIDTIVDLKHSSNELVFFKDLGYAITTLEDEQIKLVENQENSFKIQPENTITSIKTNNSDDNINDSVVSKTITIIPHHLAPVNFPDISGDLSESTSKDITYNWHWGIHRIQAHRSPNRGTGINVAILDTGFDINHPDYKYRKISTQSFVDDKTVQDNNGHGTHCIGIACGNEDTNGIRYGVAYEANIFAGKVLDNNGFGFQNNIEKGIIWALKHKCKVISISIEFKNNGTTLFNEAFNRTVRLALKENCIIVAAAGNSSNRPRVINSLGSPADLPFVLAVSAIGKNNDIYTHSNRADGSLHQNMAYTAPGVDIYSSWSRTGKPNLQNRIISGTSMAAPFIAGIIALLWENHKDDTSVSYRQILAELENLCETNNFNWLREDVGLGIPLAPIPK